MEFRVFLAFIVGVVYCVQGLPRPRDSSVAKTQDISRTDKVDLGEFVKNADLAANTEEAATTEKEAGEDDDLTKLKVVSELATSNNVINIPKLVSCEYEEATETLDCQEHCLPKGYTYGLCVNHKCSCI